MCGKIDSVPYLVVELVGSVIALLFFVYAIEDSLDSIEKRLLAAWRLMSSFWVALFRI